MPYGNMLQDIIETIDTTRDPVNFDGKMIATNLLTIALFLASNRAPTAMVTDNTVGIATGIAATVNTRANCKVVSIWSPRKTATPSSPRPEPLPG